MTIVYPSLESPEFIHAFREFGATIDRLTATFDQYGIGSNDVSPAGSADVPARFDEVVTAYNDLLRQTETLEAYIYSFASTNSRDDIAQARLSEFELQAVRISKLSTRFAAWVGSLDRDQLFAQSTITKDHQYAIQLAAIRASHQMSAAEEELAAELYVSGGGSWEKLHQTVTSQIMVPIVLMASRESCQ